MSSRLVASVGGYFVSRQRRCDRLPSLWRHLHHVGLAGGKVALRETSTYPWSGDIRIEVDPEAPAEFTLEAAHPRLGARGDGPVNGEAVAVDAATRNGYLDDQRDCGGRATSCQLDLPMPAERIYAHPGVRMDVGRVALKRGPLVYCVEEADNPGGRVQRLKLPRSAELEDGAARRPIRRHRHAYRRRVASHR